VSTQRDPVGNTSDGQRYLQAQDIEVDTAGFLVRRAGRPLPAMPMKEFQLLQILLEQAGQLMTREDIALRVWGDAAFAASNTLDQHIARLRSRIEEDPHRPRRIRTVRGSGYVFDTEPVTDGENIHQGTSR
jgi:DNA-binding response OmpR family regulator